MTVERSRRPLSTPDGHATVAATASPRLVRLGGWRTPMRILSLALSIALAVVGSTASPSAGVDRRDPSPLLNVTQNLAIIRTQIGLGISYEQSALAAVQAASGAETLHDVPAIINDGYAQLRFAVSGLRLKLQVARIPNPMFELAADNIDTAMAHIRTAKSALESAVAGDTGQMAAVIPNLEAAIQLATLAADLV